MSRFSPGSPIFLPAGVTIFNRLADFLRRQYVRYGFQEVLTPTIYKKELWGWSGHLENYAEHMFTVTSTSPARGQRNVAIMSVDIESGGEKEESEYGLKPMNCPGHCLIFSSDTRSYRHLPIRYADFSALHRDEVSGALSGLTRVRRFHQDDGHIFCRPSQIEDEILSSLDFIRVVYQALRLGPYRLVLSTQPSDSFIGTREDWDRAEGALARALDHAVGEGSWTTSPGDGAFYGPKIDVVLTDRSGKEHQTATIQLDFQMPKRFNLTYDAPTPSAKAKSQIAEAPALLAETRTATPVLIHRAVLGSLERLLALLIEHTEGHWPLWLNPRQAVVVTVNDSPEVANWAESIRSFLLGIQKTEVVREDATHARAIRPSEATGLTVDVDTSARTIPVKIKEAKAKRYGIIAVVGPKDVADGCATVDATGIPKVQGQNRRQWERMTMSPKELLSFMKNVVDAYE